MSLDQTANEEHVKKLLASTAAAAVAHSVVSDSLHGTNNNLCHMASPNHLNSLDGQHLGIHNLTHHGKQKVKFNLFAYKAKFTIETNF